MNHLWDEPITRSYSSSANVMLSLPRISVHNSIISGRVLAVDNWIPFNDNRGSSSEKIWHIWLIKGSKIIIESIDMFRHNLHFGHFPSPSAIKNRVQRVHCRTNSRHRSQSGQTKFDIFPHFLGKFAAILWAFIVFVITTFSLCIVCSTRRVLQVISGNKVDERQTKGRKLNVSFLHNIQSSSWFKFFSTISSQCENHLNYKKTQILQLVILNHMRHCCSRSKYQISLFLTQYLRTSFYWFTQRHHRSKK